MSSDKMNKALEIRKLLDAERKKPGPYQDMQNLLVRYAVERFLYRLGVSAHRHKFVLKGDLLQAVYVPTEYRDAGGGDLFAYGHYSPERMKGILQEVCALKYDDGLTFDRKKMDIKQAGADREYPEYAVVIPARLGFSNCNVRLDIEFGQDVTPNPALIEYPSLLNLPKPTLRIYPLETVVAEKFHAIVHLGLSNTRLKNYHDLAEIARCCTLQGKSVCEAMKAIFERRRTPIPSTNPLGLTANFYDAREKQTYWYAFLKRHSLPKHLALQEVCLTIEAMLMPAAQACGKEQSFAFAWKNHAWQEDPHKEKITA